MKKGFSLWEILHRENPVFITGMGLQCMQYVSATNSEFWIFFQDSMLPIEIKINDIMPFFHNQHKLKDAQRWVTENPEKRNFYMWLFFIKLNKFETDSYFLQIFQSNTSVCLIISMFCKCCEPICEPEITPVLYQLENLQKSKQKQFHVQC